jgi:hypothetical protein
MTPDFGPCCACGQSGPAVRNILMLPQKAPIAGHGWGCVQCGLPSDGAVAIVCDDCLQDDALPPLQWACCGFPATDGRVPITELIGHHEHNLDLHPEVRRCRKCGCTEFNACLVDGVPCWWVEEDLCSACAGTPSLIVPESSLIL